MSTPTRIRRSISTGDVSANPSPILRLKACSAEVEGNTEVEALQSRVTELELQLENAQLKLSANQDGAVDQTGREEELRLRVEQLEAEMETYRAELKLRDREREESEKLAEQLDTLQVSGRGWKWEISDCFGNL